MEKVSICLLSAAPEGQRKPRYGLLPICRSDVWLVVLPLRSLCFQV